MAENRAHVLVRETRDSTYLAEIQTKMAVNWIALFEELYSDRVAKAK